MPKQDSYGGYTGGNEALSFNAPGYLPPARRSHSASRAAKQLGGYTGGNEDIEFRSLASYGGPVDTSTGGLYLPPARPSPPFTTPGEIGIDIASNVNVAVTGQGPQTPGPEVEITGVGGTYFCLQSG